jgi:hypothetical protein
MDEPTQLDGNKAPLGAECPLCGENDVDRLLWDEDEQLHCTNCGTVYDPNTTPVSVQGFDEISSPPTASVDMLLDSMSTSLSIDPATLTEVNGQLFTPEGIRVYAVQRNGKIVYVTIPDA